MISAEDVQKIASQIGWVVAEMIQANWDALSTNGRNDPKANGYAKIRFACNISTIASGNHRVDMVIPAMPVKDSQDVTPNDQELEPKTALTEDPELG